MGFGRAKSETATSARTHVDLELSVLEASRIMRTLGISELLVTAECDGTLVPVGILTSRDIVTRIVAAGLDPAVLTTGDIALFNLSGADTSEIHPQGARS